MTSPSCVSILMYGKYLPLRPVHQDQRFRCFSVPWHLSLIEGATTRQAHYGIKGSKSFKNRVGYKTHGAAV